MSRIVPHRLNPGGLPQSYRPEDHLIYRYNNERDGISPRGYSGAPVWANNKDPGESVRSVWSRNPLNRGDVCLSGKCQS
jgi:hypothetical protein